MKQKMKKLLSGIIVLSMLSTLLVGCGNNSKEDKVEGKDEGKEAKVLTLYSSKDQWNDQCKKAANIIKEKYGIELDVVVMPNEDIEGVLSSKLATNDAPDLFLANAPQRAEQYNAKENCETLDDEPWVSRLAAPEILKHREDGHIYAMPVTSSASFFGGIYYNKKKMKELGYENPQPKTMDEFWAMLKDIKEQGVTPIYTTDADAWTTQIWTTMGWGVALSDQSDTIYKDLLSNKKKFSDIPEMVEVLKDLQKLHKEGYSNENHASQTYDTGISMIAEGKYPMVIQGEFFEDALAKEYPDVELGSFAIPFNDKDELAIGAYTVGMWVPKGGNVELAKKFMNYWCSEEVMGEVYKEFPTASAWSDIDGGDVLPAQKYLIDTYVNNNKYTYEWDSYFDVARPIMESFLFSGIVQVTMDEEPEKIITEWDKQYESFMKDKGVDGF